MSHITRRCNALAHNTWVTSQYQWVMLHTCMSHITHMNESCHTYEWVMSHIWMSRFTNMNEPYYKQTQCKCARHGRNVIHSYMWHKKLFIGAAHTSTVTRAYVRHNRFIRVKWPIHFCGMTALSGSLLQCVAMYCSVLQCVAVCCSVLQCVAVCCSVS